MIILEGQKSPTPQQTSHPPSTTDDPKANANPDEKTTTQSQSQSQFNGEAESILGDHSTAEKYGYINRGLKSRHIQFIALGGSIGTGLFLGIGEALTQGGPLSIFLAYGFVGIAVFCMMVSLGEMATWLPLSGAIPQFCSRFVDDAMGFAVGWNNWYSNAISVCVETSAAAILIQYWPGAADINVSAWIGLTIAVVLCLNIFAVSIYGEAEFVFASLKLLTIVGLIICGLCIDLGGSPKHDRIGFRYWRDPGAMNEYIAGGAEGRFLGWFSTLVQASFSFGGVESVAVAAGEAENPRRNIPKAIRRVAWRILAFYVLGALIIGMIVPFDDAHLLNAQENGKADGAQSPWVVAVNNAGIPVLPHIINAVILSSAVSAANAFLYVGSRYLYALALNGQAPSVFLRCNKNGLPYLAVLATASISLLTFMSASSGANKVFTWFMNLTTIASLLTWISVCIAYLRFHRALSQQGVSRETLVYKSPLQPYLAWISLLFFCVVTFFNGFDAFAPRWDVSTFLTAYIGLAIYGVLYVGWKVVKGTRWVRVGEADIWTGKAAVDAMVWPEERARNWVERVWFWIA